MCPMRVTLCAQCVTRQHTSNWRELLRHKPTAKMNVFVSHSPGPVWRSTMSMVMADNAAVPLPTRMWYARGLFITQLQTR